LEEVGRAVERIHHEDRFSRGGRVWRHLLADDDGTRHLRVEDFPDPGFGAGVPLTDEVGGLLLTDVERRAIGAARPMKSAATLAAATAASRRAY
jgi:hypothetical protein